eukprot:6999788-Prymnesium_polylepis.1
MLAERLPSAVCRASRRTSSSTPSIAPIRSITSARAWSHTARSACSSRRPARSPDAPVVARNSSMRSATFTVLSRSSEDDVITRGFHERERGRSSLSAERRSRA